MTNKKQENRVLNLKSEKPICVAFSARIFYNSCISTIRLNKVMYENFLKDDKPVEQLK